MKQIGTSEDIARMIDQAVTVAFFIVWIILILDPYGWGGWIVSHSNESVQVTFIYWLCGCHLVSRSKIKDLEKKIGNLTDRGAIQ